MQAITLGSRAGGSSGESVKTFQTVGQRFDFKAQKGAIVLTALCDKRQRSRRWGNSNRLPSCAADCADKLCAAKELAAGIA